MRHWGLSSTESFCDGVSRAVAINYTARKARRRVDGIRATRINDNEWVDDSLSFSYEALRSLYETCAVGLSRVEKRQAAAGVSCSLEYCIGCGPPEADFVLR